MVPEGVTLVLTTLAAGGPGRGQRALVLGGRLRDVAGPAKGLESVGVVGVLAWLALERGNVVAFQATSLAARDAYSHSDESGPTTKQGGKLLSLSRGSTNLD